MKQPGSAKCENGMAVAPHALAAESAVAILKEGGNAVEAMVAAAATIAVIYPHMNGIGGDGFWLISGPGRKPVAIQACGYAGEKADIAFYQQRGLAQIPSRGPLAANTVAGTVGGWSQALTWAGQHLSSPPLALSRLLKEALSYARNGVAVTPGLHGQICRRLPQLAHLPGFSELFAPGGQPLQAGEMLRQPALASTLERLIVSGLDDFYRGETASLIAADLAAVGSPLTPDDLQRFSAPLVEPLVLEIGDDRVYNLPPPSQGLVSLLITGIIEEQRKKQAIHSESDFIHQCVEATKLAFNIRDSHITDPAWMREEPQTFLTADAIRHLSEQICPDRAMPWGRGRGPADTIWMGVVDREGTAVSFIQSIYHEFGSAVVLPQSGIIWQNRGSSFSLDPLATNPLQPGRLPFHTLNPGLAQRANGDVMVYGSMGGDGQPQTLATLFDRIINQGMEPQAAISAPRWLLGRTWGENSDTLKIENRISQATKAILTGYGHDVETCPAYDDLMGHAGAILRYHTGELDGGSDPRSDGGVASY